MKFMLLVLLAAEIAAAQKTNWADVKTLPVDRDVRVSIEGGKSLRGRVQSVTEESLIILSAGSQETIARAQVVKLAAKGKSHRMRNTLIGLGVGAGAGVGIGAGTDANCSPHCFFGNNLGKEILTPIGALLGAIVGLAWPTGLWHEIYRR